MGLLEEKWSSICSVSSLGGTDRRCVAEGFLYPWSTNTANMEMLCKTIELQKPDIVIELGTFEGYGTMRMAESLSKAGGGELWTFDADEYPVDCLGEQYGVTKDKRIEAEGEFLVDWKKLKGTAWESWKKVTEKRDQRLAREYPGVIINFIKGITYKTLPQWLRVINFWDFCYQDTVHTLPQILKEWEHLKHFSRIGSIIVFDNVPVSEKNKSGEATLAFFRRWAVANPEKQKWSVFHTNIGTGQLWMERLS